MSDEIFFDTNVIAYAFDDNEIKKKQVSGEFLSSVFEKKVSGVLSNQVLFELFLVLKNKLKRPVSQIMAENLVESFIIAEGWKKIDYNYNTIREALHVVDKHKIPFGDAVIASTMLENGIKKIYTENENDFKKIPGIVVINPFRK